MGITFASFKQSLEVYSSLFINSTFIDMVS